MDKVSINNIDLTKFRKIDDWHIDKYTGVINVWSSGRSIHNMIPESVMIDGYLKKGSYICVGKDEACQITSVTILSATIFNKTQNQKK